MKRTTFAALCLGLFLFSCEKKVVAPNPVTVQSSSIDDQSPDLHPDLKPPGDNTIKSVSFPTFDLINPTVSFDARNSIYIKTYFETGYSDGDTDYWLKHEFQFEDHTVTMVYHYIVEDNQTLSEVYSAEGNYQFTYIDSNGEVSVEQDDSLNPVEMYDGFYDCLMHQINIHYDWIILIGAPAIIRYSYHCYRICR